MNDILRTGNGGADSGGRRISVAADTFSGIERNVGMEYLAY